MWGPSVIPVIPISIWRTREAKTAKMEELIQTDPIDESAVLAQAEIMLDLENKVKISRLTMLVRIKNVLREEQ